MKRLGGKNIICGVQRYRTRSGSDGIKGSTKQERVLSGLA